MKLYEGADLFLCPVVVTSSNNSIRFQANDTWTTITIAPGTYFMGVNLPSGFSSLVDALSTAINDLSGTYTISSATPTVSSSRFWGGLKISRTFGSGSYGIDPGHANTTFAVEDLLGFSEETVTSNGDIVSQRVRGGGWDSYSIASRKLVNITMDQHLNGGRGDVIQVTRWGRDKIRLFEYSSIPACHIREGRSSGTYASIGGLGEGDENNKFQRFWEDGISSYKKVICIHNGSGSSDGWDATENPYEILQSLPGSEHAKSLENAISREARNAEHYSVSFGMRVLSGNYRES